MQEYNCKHALYFRLHREMQGTQIQVKGLQQVSMSLFHCNPARCSPEVLTANFDTLLRQKSCSETASTAAQELSCSAC